MTLAQSVSKPKNWLIALLVQLYDNQRYHWIISVPLAPLDWLFGLLYRVLNLIWPVTYWQELQSRPEPKFPLPKTPDDLPVEPEACDACGKYLATMVGTYVDAARLSALLPPGTSLDPIHIHNGQHSLVLMFGYTQNLRRVWWPFSGMSYLEFLVGVPNLLLDDKKRYVCQFFYLPVLHLNRFYPTLLGWLVGYRKKWSRVRATENTYSIRSLFTGRKILDATFNLQPRAAAYDTQHWQDMLNEPEVNPFGDDQLFLHFHWDWADAVLQPVTAQVTIYEEIPGLSPGTYSFQPIDMGQWLDGMAPQGAIRLSCPFELLSPFSRTLLEQNERRLATLAAVQAKAGPTATTSAAPVNTGSTTAAAGPANRESTAAAAAARTEPPAPH